MVEKDTMSGILLALASAAAGIAGVLIGFWLRQTVKIRVPFFPREPAVPEEPGAPLEVDLSSLERILNPRTNQRKKVRLTSDRWTQILPIGRPIVKWLLENTSDQILEYAFEPHPRISKVLAPEDEVGETSRPEGIWVRKTQDREASIVVEWWEP